MKKCMADGLKRSRSPPRYSYVLTLRRRTKRLSRNIPIKSPISTPPMLTDGGPNPPATIFDGLSPKPEAGIPYRFLCDFNQLSTGRLLNEISLFGQPASLTLRVKSDLPGVRLFMKFGSHFHYYDRELGTLDGKGEQSFTAPLGDMATWTHSGANEAVSVIRSGCLKSAWRANPPQAKDSLNSWSYPSGRCAIPLIPIMLLAQPGPRGQRDTQFTLKAYNLRPTPVRGVLRDEWLNFAGLTLAKGESPTPRFRRPAGRKYGRLADRDSKMNRSWKSVLLSPPRTARSFRPTRPVLHRSRPKAMQIFEPDSPIGVGLYLYRYPDTEEGHRIMGRAAAMAQAAGVKWTREEFLWIASNAVAASSTGIITTALSRPLDVMEFASMA